MLIYAFIVQEGYFNSKLPLIYAANLGTELQR
jgi:hypothetical protein